MPEGLIGLIGAEAATGGEEDGDDLEGRQCPSRSLAPDSDAAARSRYRAYAQASNHADEPLMKALSNMPGSLVVRSRGELVPNDKWYRCAFFNDYLRPSHLNHSAYSICDVSEEHAVSVVALYRGLRDSDFSDRERQLLRFFHGGLGRMVSSSLSSVFDPDPLQLPRREKETLACLLEGDSEKQVALRLGVSPLTVHQYVKSLYRRFRVRSRAELLAYFLRRQRAFLRSNAQTPTKSS